ncbi:hypothetical protein FGIG_09544 [Fasciola gigantica]|uniref:Uncharacterized protein n=1 Tax=Fasciola gigantica TaxID=46835 RepID=A0A504YV61_FASGI|nr:hypothetical protein FGIG_09544 [Fasciola gigantica]
MLPKMESAIFLIVVVLVAKADDIKVVPTEEEQKLFSPILSRCLCKLTSERGFRIDGVEPTITHVDRKGESNARNYRLYIRVSENICYTVDSDYAESGDRKLKNLQSTTC